MSKDIRLELSFLTHRKRKKLQSLLGPQGVLSVIDLWLSTAENRPKGILTGMNETDIALDAQWPGDPDEFCRVLCEVVFLDRGEDGTYSIHGWKEHQRYVYFSEERSNVARNAAEKRWKRRRGIKPKTKEKQKDNADIMLPACGEHTKGNAPSPTPSPSPSPKNILRDSKKPNPAVKEFIDFWYQTFQETFGAPYMVNKGKDGDLVKKLLGNYTLDRLKELAGIFFQSNDPFPKKAGYTIGVFHSQINKLVGKKDPYAGLFKTA